MSHLSGSKPEYDFWDYVNCARCHLSYASDLGGPQVPFWLTECGHVLCNNHLNPDRSCAQCGSCDIELVSLQRQMDPPMSDWFMALPYALDGAANAAKFQQETLASLVQYYKNKCQKAMDRLRTEIEERKALKKENEELRRQNHHLQEHAEPSNTMNGNGKRPMTGSYRAGNSSSPRSIVTPIGPDRLTIPPSQNAPHFARQPDSQRLQEQEQRPGSSRFTQQYAYNPQQPAPQFRPSQVQLSHAQAAPARQLQARHNDQQRGTMPPPPPPAPSKAIRSSENTKFKPASQLPGTTNNSVSNRPNLVNDAYPPDRVQSASVDRRQMQMGPPPTPRLHTSTQRFGFSPQDQPQASNQGYHPSTSGVQHQAQKSSARQGMSGFIPSTSKPSNQQQFAHAPPTPMGASRRFNVTSNDPGSRSASRATNYPPQGLNTIRQAGQRMPFVSSGNGQGGFG